MDQKTKLGWFVYLLECADGRIYTGITNDVEARFSKHLAGKGAKFTRANPPVRVMASLACCDRSEASKKECEVKRLSAAQKRVLAKEWSGG